jgi:hypothetical protein
MNKIDAGCLLPSAASRAPRLALLPGAGLLRPPRSFLPSAGAVTLNTRQATTQRQNYRSDGFTYGDEMSVQPIGVIRAGRSRANTRGGGFDPAKRQYVIPAADAWAGGGGGRYSVVALTIRISFVVHVNALRDKEQ